MRAVAVVALAALLVTASFAISRRESQKEATLVANVAAPPGVSPIGQECAQNHEAALTDRAVTVQQYQQLLFATIPAVERAAPSPPHEQTAVIPESALPSGREPNAATRTAIEAAVRREVACRNAAMFPESGQVVTPVASDLGTPSPEPGGRQRVVPIPVPDILRMTLLADGRVGVLLSTDLFGLGLEMYLVYAPVGGAWILDDSGQVASDAWIAAGYTGPIQDAVEIGIWDSYFWPAEVAIPADRPVSVTVINHGEKPHRFVIDDLGVAVSLAPGETTTIQIVAAPTGHLFTIDIANQDWQSGNVLDLGTGGYVWALDMGSPTPAATP